MRRRHSPPKPRAPKKRYRRRRVRPLRLRRKIPAPPGYETLKVEAQLEGGSVLQVIAEAARGLHPVRFYYVRRDGYAGEYEVEPYSVRAGFPGPDVYLFAYHPECDSIHSFVLANISYPQVVEEETFVPLWEIEF